MGEAVADFAQRPNRLALAIVRDAGARAGRRGRVERRTGPRVGFRDIRRHAGRPARDVLFVAAIDRTGETAVVETPLSQQADGTVEPGESRVWGGGYDVNVFDGVRAAWGLARRRELGFDVSADVPDDWEVTRADKMIELLPPTDKASAHISVFRGGRLWQ